MEDKKGRCPALAGCGMFDDEDLKGWLKQFPDAEDMDLSGSQITSGSAATLAKFPCLWALDLSKTAVDDAVVDALSDMKLLLLDVTNTRVTPEGVRRLRAALEPPCVVLG